MAEERGEEVEMRVMSKKEKSKKKKGILHYVCIVLVSVFLTYILVAIGLLFLPQVIPHTKTNFKSYKAFREKAFDFDLSEPAEIEKKDENKIVPPASKRKRIYGTV